MALCGDDTCGMEGGAPVLQRWVTLGQCLTIRVGGWEDTIGTGTMEISCEPTPCLAAATPIPEATPVPKNRFLSFIMPISEEEAAIRVTAVELKTHSSYDGGQSLGRRTASVS